MCLALCCSLLPVLKTAARQTKPSCPVFILYSQSVRQDVCHFKNIWPVNHLFEKSSLRRAEDENASFSHLTSSAKSPQ